MRWLCSALVLTASVALLCAMPIAAGDGNDDDRDPTWAFVEAPGGEATVLSFSGAAFSTTLSGLPLEARVKAGDGGRLFAHHWTATGTHGLGPRFVNDSCDACHGRDGKSVMPGGPRDGLGGAVLFLIDAGSRGNAHGSNGGSPDRVLVRAIDGFAPDASASVEWEHIPWTLPEGRIVQLRRPRYEVRDIRAGAFDADAVLSLRAAPATFGLGLIEAIPEADIEAHARACRYCALGIRGRVARVRDNTTGRIAAGRFGWKATHASITSASVEALEKDIGIKPPMEIGQNDIDKLVLYLQTLGVPARAFDARAPIARGARLFHSAHCDACHRPAWSTGRAHDLTVLRGQTIYPFTDLLLHDMGSALASAHPGSDARPHEWRTPPLWGLGLNRRVTGREEYLHDGRARSIEDAVLWHDGEARISRRIYEDMSPAQKNDLLAFLESL